MEHESAFTKSFVLPDKQSRWLELLSNPRRRAVFLHRLADDRDLDTRFQVLLTPPQQNAQSVVNILKKKGAPERCYVISESSDFDGKEMLLIDAIEEVLGYGMGSIISCVAGKLVYYEGEMPSHRYILERK